MNDVNVDPLVAMQQQYGDSRLLEALASEFADEPAERRFPAVDLALVDQLHTRGYAATVDFATTIGVDAETLVLDVGAGLGGPARFLAETYGCRVFGIDATAALVRGAKYLTSRWSGRSDLVEFRIGDALALPHDDASFDLVWMQHVAMNIRDRAALYCEVRRVLRPGGRFATYDVVRKDGELVYPTPWAREAAASTVLTSEETRAALEDAGFHITWSMIDTPAALDWVSRTSAAASAIQPPPRGARMLRAALGENFREILANLGKNYVEGRADVLALIAERTE